MHSRAIKARLALDVCVGCNLLDMYAKCGGSMDDSRKVFDQMPHHNIMSWTTIVMRYVQSGRDKEAIKLFFDSMCKDHGIVPRMEHYACMVDLLGRSGFPKESHELIHSMSFEADALVWLTLLGACRIHGDMELGEIATRHILELEPHDPTAYVLLSNLYASQDQWDDVARIRKKMKERKLKKEDGCSWIELNSMLHKFYVGDTSHQRAREIYTKLDELASEIKGMEYVPDTNCVLYEVEEGQKEQYMFQHSEKIAVAFGLISSSSSGPIRVFKNLRVCGDCHTTIKYISLASGREIIIRDSNRFHHIKDGVCSCGEYW